MNSTWVDTAPFTYTIGCVLWFEVVACSLYAL